MKCIKYSEDFERLWNSFDGAYGNKGSKKKAYSVYKSLDVYADDLQMLLNAVGFQKAEKQQKMIAGQFYENFQHVERWLRNERWTDEISSVFIKESRSEQIEREYRQYLETLESGALNG